MTTTTRAKAGKTIAIVTALAAAAALLAGCGTSGSQSAAETTNQTPAATAPATPPAPESTTPAPDAVEIDEVQPNPAPAEPIGTTERGTAAVRQEFLAAVRENVPELAGASNRSVLDLAYAAVDAYQAGADLPDVLAVLTDEGGWDAGDAGYFVGASVGAFAPELQDQFMADVAYWYGTG